MNRARKIINLLEGFKLGSLGAGTKFAPDEPQNLGYKISHISWSHNRVQKMGKFYYHRVKWTESKPDDQTFKFGITICRESMGAESEQTYVVNVYGGININLEGSGHHFDFTYERALPDKDELSFEETEKIVQDLFQKIQLEGSFGLALAKGRLEGSWKLWDYRGTQDYIQKTTGVPDNLYAVEVH